MTFLYDPGVLLQRADIHANRGDRYGQRAVAKNVVDEGQVKYNTYSKSGQSPYEMMFKHSIGLDGLDFVVTGDDDVSARVIQILKDNGIEQINGKPLEEVIMKSIPTPARRYSPDPEGVDDAYREMTQQTVEKVVQSLQKNGNPAFDFKSTQDYYAELESYVRMAQDNNGFPLPATKKIEVTPAPGLASAKNVTPLFHRYIEQGYSTSKGKATSSVFVVYLSGEVNGKKRYFKTVIAPKGTTVHIEDFQAGTVSHTQAKSLLNQPMGDFQLVNIG